MSNLTIYINLFYSRHHFRIIPNILNFVHNNIGRCKYILNHDPATWLTFTRINSNRFTLIWEKNWVRRVDDSSARNNVHINLLMREWIYELPYLVARYPSNLYYKKYDDHHMASIALDAYVYSSLKHILLLKTRRKLTILPNNSLFLAD